jgi:hypothetical protein
MVSDKKESLKEKLFKKAAEPKVEIKSEPATIVGAGKECHRCKKTMRQVTPKDYHCDFCGANLTIG